MVSHASEEGEGIHFCKDIFGLSFISVGEIIIYILLGRIKKVFLCDPLLEYRGGCIM